MFKYAIKQPIKVNAYVVGSFRNHAAQLPNKNEHLTSTVTPEPGTVQGLKGGSVLLEYMNI